MIFKNAENFTNYLMEERVDTRQLPWDLDRKISPTLFQYRTFGAGKSFECYKTEEYKSLEKETFEKIVDVLKQMYVFPIDWNYELIYASGGSTCYKSTIEEKAPYQMTINDFLEVNT